MGRHKCEHCQTVFKISHNWKYYVSMNLLAIFLGLSVAFLSIYLKLSTLHGLVLYFLLVLAVLFPLDKRMDNSKGITVLRSK